MDGGNEWILRKIERDNKNKYPKNLRSRWVHINAIMLPANVKQKQSRSLTRIDPWQTSVFPTDRSNYPLTEMKFQMLTLAVIGMALTVDERHIHYGSQESRTWNLALVIIAMYDKGASIRNDCISCYKNEKSVANGCPAREFRRLKASKSTNVKIRFLWWWWRVLKLTQKKNSSIKYMNFVPIKITCTKLMPNLRARIDNTTISTCEKCARYLTRHLSLWL